MKILIATHNMAKLEEIGRGLQNLAQNGVVLTSLKVLGITTEPQETGMSFQENSLLKAQWYSHLTNLPTISDDGGLNIVILNGEPGVKSRRWLGYEGTDQELINYTLERLKGVKKEKRRAYLQTCITFYDPFRHKTISETEKIEGTIASIPNKKFTPGYPYRALFVVDRYDKYYDNLTQIEHEKINHRLIALKRLSKKISSYLLQ